MTLDLEERECEGRQYSMNPVPEKINYWPGNERRKAKVKSKKVKGKRQGKPAIN
jgi:hypothetical protein